jgi:hypothetical protein
MNFFCLLFLFLSLFRRFFLHLLFVIVKIDEMVAKQILPYFFVGLGKYKMSEYLKSADTSFFIFLSQKTGHSMYSI